MLYQYSYRLGAYAPGLDPDAKAYIAAVEAADGQALEPAVRVAYNQFIRGCKTDGIWDAIKASCILAGARTLSGALVPLKGTAPTNNNFVSGDYNRETGLAGDGLTKYLNSNRSANSDPQNSKHVAVYTTQASTSLACLIGHRPDIFTDVTQIFENPGSFTRAKVNGSAFAEITASPVAGFSGGNRASSTQITARANSTTVTASATSLTPSADTVIVCARLTTTGAVIDAYSDARFAFYSIGESLDLALLDARVSTLITDLAAAIP